MVVVVFSDFFCHFCFATGKLSYNPDRWGTFNYFCMTYLAVDVKRKFITSPNNNKRTIIDMMLAHGIIPILAPPEIRYNNVVKIFCPKARLELGTCLQLPPRKGRRRRERGTRRCQSRPVLMPALLGSSRRFLQKHESSGNTSQDNRAAGLDHTSASGGRASTSAGTSAAARASASGAVGVCRACTGGTSSRATRGTAARC